MNVLIFASWYPTKDNPCHGVFFREQANCLASHGCRACVIGLGHRKRRSSHFFRLITNLFDLVWPYRMLCHKQVPEIVLMEPRDILFHLPWLRSLWSVHIRRAYRRLVRFFPENRPDVIHVQSLIGLPYLGERILSEGAIPAVATEHFSGFLRGAVSSTALLRIRALENRFGVVSAVGKGLQDALNDTLARDVVWAPNSVDCDWFTLGPVLPLKPFRFAVVCGLLDSNKNIDGLIRAFALAFDTFEDVELTIGGEGPLLGGFEQLASRTHMIGRVFFIGRLERDGVRELFHSSHVVVSSSFTETFGLTLIEAMACGRPVLATRSGGPECFVNRNNGLLVNTDDESIARGLREIREAHSRFSAEKIRAFVEEQFSAEAYARRMEALFREAARSGPGHRTLPRKNSVNVAQA